MMIHLDLPEELETLFYEMCKKTNKTPEQAVNEAFESYLNELERDLLASGHLKEPFPSEDTKK